jgi:hypothetical protein
MTSRDPLAGYGITGQEYPYLYARNNPITFVDSSGLEAVKHSTPTTVGCFVLCATCITVFGPIRGGAICLMCLTGGELYFSVKEIEQARNKSEEFAKQLEDINRKMDEARQSGDTSCGGGSTSSYQANPPRWLPSAR